MKWGIKQGFDPFITLSLWRFRLFLKSGDSKRNLSCKEDRILSSPFEAYVITRNGKKYFR